MATDDASLSLVGTASTHLVKQSVMDLFSSVAGGEMGPTKLIPISMHVPWSLYRSGI